MRGWRHVLAAGAVLLGSVGHAVRAGAADDATPDGAPDAAAGANRSRPGEWMFEVLLDGKPIGEHRFAVSARGDERSVTSEAHFDVKLFGLTVYRYRHKATEHWRGDCLHDLSATTNDNGKTLAVRGERRGDVLHVSSPGGEANLTGCVMTFAYWNPAMRHQVRLLNAQTGKYEAVRVGPAGTAAIEAHGRSVTATRWRISGPESPVDLLLAADGEWVGLDATVSGNRHLAYRLP